MDASLPRFSNGKLVGASLPLSIYTTSHISASPHTKCRADLAVTGGGWDQRKHGASKHIVVALRQSQS